MGHRRNKMQNGRYKSNYIKNNIKYERIKSSNEKAVTVRLAGQKDTIQVYDVYRRHTLFQRIEYFNLFK